MSIVEKYVLWGGCVVASPIREIAAAAAAAGFDAITLWPAMCVRAEERHGLGLSELRAVLDEAGVGVAMLETCDDWLLTANHGEAPFRSVWSRDDFFDAANILGASSVAAAHLTGGSVDRGRAIEGFAGLCDDAARHGLQVAIEPISFTGISDPADAWAIVAGADRSNSGLTIDTAHLARAGHTVNDLAEIPAGRILAVQLADGPVQAPPDLVDEAMYGRVLPGEGQLGIAGTVTALGSLGVQAMVGPEVFRREWRELGVAAAVQRLMDSCRNVAPA